MLALIKQQHTLFLKIPGSSRDTAAKKKHNNRICSRRQVMKGIFLKESLKLIINIILMVGAAIMIIESIAG